jgi:hypothetical protein
VQDLTTNGKIQTVSDLMVNIEDEINAIKSGELKEGQARLVMRGRTIQMKGLELYLQAARIEANLRPALGRRMGVIEAAAEPVPAT